jgi:hypothetical protein
LLVRAGEPSRYTSVEVEKKPDTPGGPA